MLCVIPLYSQSATRCYLMRFATHSGSNNRKSRSSLQRTYCPLFVSASPLCSVFESPGHLLSMSQTLRKREREPESPPGSIDVGEPKRFHGEETDRFLDLLQLDKTLADDDDEEECPPSEELVNGVMRSFEEEIAATCSTSYGFSNSQDNSAASDIFSGQERKTLEDSDSGFDLCYLLEASDDDLGIPPSPILDLKQEVCLSPKEISEGLSENLCLKSIGENWHLEDSFDNYQQFTLYEDSWDASQLQDHMNRESVSQSMLFDGDGDFSVAWRLETAVGL